MIETQMIKGLLKSIVLKILLEHKRMYGYEITQKVVEVSNGNIQLTLGALYPILHKLEGENELQTESEIFKNRTRVYYKLTAQGLKTANQKIAELEVFKNTISHIINYKNQ